ncbi:hypothetical protein GCM10009785_32980 [Brooklawnia cerclae]|uniref:Murein DD-endopeptidase MepM/ murein hydrolase activator NlpD n=1 Tax=Brooklawnia cerclae TaxID=349934 RepID=A0ABX0SJF2_9ACTN|nr:murein DD-endopeptidase MepM/ murein hydrolase activator NlpD [Brooklawnia cerclae]
MLLLITCMLGLVGAGTQLSAASPTSRVVPLPGPVLRDFEAAEPDWLRGHRGVDLGGDAGAQVMAAADGTVAWVGTINGVSMVSVQHPDGIRTTYQPVDPAVSRGEAVRAGQMLGTLLPGHCTTGACLHWGVRQGERYLDPMVWLGGGAAGEVRLLPRSAVPRQQPPEGAIESADAVTALAGGLPVAGPVTSPFGSRVNPISGATEFHDGIDIGVPCGTPVVASAPGVVLAAGTAGGFGLRVELDHGTVGGAQRGSSYSHLSRIDVSAGQQVRAGEIVGLVGTTGYSTGCHLHYSVTVDGSTVDPLGVG